MPTNLSPDVSFTEKDYTQVIPTVTSAVGGMVIHTEKGPVNKRILLTNPKDLETIFGRPNDTNFTHWFTAEAFLKQSNQLYVVRVEDTGKKVAGVTIGINQTGLGNVVLSDATTKPTEVFPLDYADIKSHEAKFDYSLPEGSDPGELDNSDNNLYTEDAYHFYAVGPGPNYEKVSVVVINSSDFAQLQELKAELAEAATQEEMNVIASRYYNGVACNDCPGQYADYLSNSLVKYDIFTPASSSSPDWYIDTSYLSVVTSFENGPTTSDEAALIVFDQTGEPVEQYVFSNDKDKLDEAGNRIFGPTLVNGKSSLIYFFIGADEVGAAGISQVTTRKTSLGGADPLTTSLGNLTGEILTAFNDHFTNKEDLEVDILIDPDYADVVKRYMDQICKEIRRDCVSILQIPLAYILNPSNKRPVAQPYQSMKNYVANVLNVNSSYSATYGNYFKIFDRFSEKERWVPATGYAAAVMAFTDFNDAPWFAPAGLNRAIISNVIDIAVNPNKGQRDILYYNRINPIVKFQGEGIVIWGQKTLQSGASAFDRINVRRLFLHIEKAVSKFARQMLFEFNDDFTRTRFRGIVNPFLTQVKARRGCYDFLVVCDETNNTPEVVDNNAFKAEILVKPTRVAEFINLTFSAVGTGTEFTEVVSKM